MSDINKTKHLLSLSLIGLVFLINSCDFYDNRLKIINNSTRDIYFTFTCDSSLEKGQILQTRYYSYYSTLKADSAYNVLESIKSESRINYRMWGFRGWSN